MKRQSLLTLSVITFACVGLFPTVNYAHSYSRQSTTTNSDVIAYALLGSPEDVELLKNTLNGYHGSYPFTQLDISFLSPTMNPEQIKKDNDMTNQDERYNALLSDAFFSVDGKTSYATASGSQGSDLQTLISTLANSSIGVYFSVGGWAYSNGGSSNNTTTFPLTTDILKNLQTYHSGATTDWFSANNNETPVGIHAALDSDTTPQLTDTWTAVAKAFGAKGIDLDYEEQWFPAQVFKHYKDAVPNHNWSYKNNFSTIKYAAYIQALETSSKAQGTMVSIAAPSIGAFNVNAIVDHDPIAGNFFYPSGNAAPLKGVIYNMLHPDEAGLSAVNPLFFTDSTESVNILNALSSVGVMSYDLDDGYVNRNSYWCIGWKSNTNTETGHPIARDPIGGGITNVSCSVYDQTLAIARSFNQLGITAPMNMGVEAYYPNYPTDPNVIDSSNSQYRWNDPFIAFDIPVKLAPSFASAQTVPFTVAGGSGIDNNPNLNDYTHFWLVPKDLANDLKNMNNGVIFWSINNAEKTIMDNDKTQAIKKNSAFFGNYSQNLTFIGPLLDQAEDWQDVIQDLYNTYH